jgi:hypothetical protein
MRRYGYTPFDLDTGEIRLIQLHSGAFEDPTRISVVTERLVIPEQRPPRKDFSEEIQDGLPSDGQLMRLWKVASYSGMNASTAPPGTIRIQIVTK